MREETAFSLHPIVRKAATIVFGQFEGGTWDWDAMDWRRERT